MDSLSEQDKETLRQIFKEIDKDNSGTLSKNEIVAFFKSKGMTTQDAEDFLTKLDENADGKVTFDEYGEKVGLIPPKAGKGVVWKLVFESFDKDNNGYLDKDEFMKILQENGMAAGITEEQIKDFIKTIDVNGDGRINYDEYIKWVTNM